MKFIPNQFWFILIFKKETNFQVNLEAYINNLRAGKKENWEVRNIYDINIYLIWYGKMYHKGSNANVIHVFWSIWHAKHCSNVADSYHINDSYHRIVKFQVIWILLIGWL